MTRLNFFSNFAHNYEQKAHNSGKIKFDDSEGGDADSRVSAS